MEHDPGSERATLTPTRVPWTLHTVARFRAPVDISPEWEPRSAEKLPIGYHSIAHSAAAQLSVITSMGHNKWFSRENEFN
eukprot:4809618-Amphidinium_carterae.1